jgi:arylsulfatase A-like enzyme
MKLFLLCLLCSYTCIIAQRNVVLIIADDLSSEYCGFIENHRDTVKLPNIRRLLANGIVFNKAWSNPLCSPTRAGILTGRYSFRTGVGDAVGGQGSRVLDTAEMTIPRMLHIFKPNGIAKANIGKWHLHSAMPQTNYIFPLTLGYDHYEGNFAGQLPSFYSWNKIKDGKTAVCNTYATTELTNNAIDWVKSVPQNKPFFLWLAYNAPHSPFHLPPSNLHSYTELKGIPADTASSVIPYFKAMSEALDKEIGRLFDTLQAHNIMDSTDIIFIGDNGSDMKVSQVKGGAKGGISQEGISVPFIISGPSVKNPGRYSNALVNTHDLFATIIELMGFSNWKQNILQSKPVDSKSLLPIIYDQDSIIRDWVFSEVFKLTPVAGDGKTMRNKEYKLMDYDNGTQKFVNLLKDPEENIDLLQANLTGNDKTNYEYLCGEMSKLVGTGAFCTALSVQNSDTDEYFTSYFDSQSSLLTLQFHKPLQKQATVHIYSANGKLEQSVEILPHQYSIQVDMNNVAAGLKTISLIHDDLQFKKAILIHK